jgi:hypothetical protein
MMEEHLNKPRIMVKELDTIGAPISPKVMVMVFIDEFPSKLQVHLSKVVRIH